MKAKYITSFLLLIGIILNAQTFIGTYIQQTNNKIPTKIYNSIVSSEGITQFTTTSVSKPTDENPNIERTQNENGNTIEHVSDDYMFLTPTKLPEIYKKENSNELLSRNFIITKECYIKEDLNQMTWEISDETIVHNGRNCNIATTHFRGKDWTVYFDTSIPFNVAPWKFYGLPGVVIYAVTSDNEFIFELKDFEIKEENTEIKNPFEKEKMMSWNQYTKNYKQYLKKILKWSSDPDDEPGGGKIEINNIEDLGFKEVKGN